MASILLTTPGAGQWQVAAADFTVTCIGGGGAGGAATGNPARAGGGAGGACTRKAYTGQTVGALLDYSIAGASSASSSAVVNGSDTWFLATGTQIAKGGAGGATATGSTSAGG